MIPGFIVFGSFFFMKVDTSLSKNPPVIFPVRLSSLPKSISDNVLDLRITLILAPNAAPPSNPIPLPVRPAPTIAPVNPPAKPSGRYFLNSLATGLDAPDLSFLNHSLSPNVASKDSFILYIAFSAKAETVSAATPPRSLRSEPIFLNSFFKCGTNFLPAV